MSLAFWVLKPVIANTMHQLKLQQWQQTVKYYSNLQIHTLNIVSFKALTYLGVSQLQSSVNMIQQYQYTLQHNMNITVN